MKNQMYYDRKERHKKSFKKRLSRLPYKIKSMSFARHILFLYLIITALGAVLLYMPFTQTGNLEWDPITNTYKKGEMSFIDVLFTAASAFSDTGLAVNSTGVVFNEIGQMILSLLILLGGIGLFALKVYIFNIIFNRPISFKTREALAAERGSVKVGVTRQLIKVAVTALLIILILAAATLTIIFYYTDVSGSKTDLYDKAGNLHTLSNDKLLVENPYKDPIVALRYGFFHAVSALNNAGFDIIGNSSLQPYYYIYSVQIVFIILFVVGGMGYPVIYDIYTWSTRKSKTGERFRFSLFTKLSVTTYFLVSAFGLIATSSIEAGNKDSLMWSGEYGSKGDRALAIIFNTMSTRNAGFSTISMHELSKGTITLYIVLMFIGSAPSSTAGGIRTTTLAILFLALWSMMRGRKNVYAFKKRINNETVKKSFIVFVTSIAIVLIGSLISLTSLDSYGGKIPTIEHIIATNKVSEIKPHVKVFAFQEIIFEVASAFGTTGLSSGITPQLSIYSKVAIILIMFIGQLGVSSSILIWGSKRTDENHFGRVIEDVSIG